jgi:hypothetical protein
MKQNNKASIVIIILVTAVLGIVLGAIGQRFFDSGITTKTKNAKVFFEKMISPVVVTATAYGTVDSVDNTTKTIVLKNQNSILPIKISNEAVVYSVEGGKPVLQGKGSVARVNVGDTANISFKVNTDGTISGEAVFILFKNVLKANTK